MKTTVKTIRNINRYKVGFSLNEVMENIGIYVPIQSETMSRDNANVRFITVLGEDSRLHTFFMRMPDYIIPFLENNYVDDWKMERFEKVNEQITITFGDL